jgi:DNA polymerase-3 subunit chi
MTDAIPRVDFYVHDSDAFEALAATACRLVDKAWQQAPGRHIVIRVEDDDQAQRLDDLLWTFRDRAFLPHAVATAGNTDESCPVLICTALVETPASHRNLLVNLAAAMAPDAVRYARVAELVDASPARRQAGRTRFRQWRELRVEPQTHRLAPVP